MKCNIRELAQLSDQPCIIEGRLNYKKISNGSYRNQTVFKERWFRLIKNYLFYFKISEMGKFDTKNPAGMFVMENSSIQMEHGLNIPFSFSISFICLHRNWNFEIILRKTLWLEILYLCMLKLGWMGNPKSSTHLGIMAREFEEAKSDANVEGLLCEMKQSKYSLVISMLDRRPRMRMPVWIVTTTLLFIEGTLLIIVAKWWLNSLNKKVNSLVVGLSYVRVRLGVYHRTQGRAVPMCEVCGAHRRQGNRGAGMRMKCQRDEPEKRHIFAARAEDNVVQWVMKLRECSYEYLRSRLHTLQSKIYSITGKDPLLLVPRNEGACLWAPSVPYSTTPACTVNTSSFSCHLHTNGAFTLERSKSDVQAHKHFHAEFKNKTKFYTETHQTNNEEKQSSSQVFYLERSKTSALLPGSTNVLNTSIFDNRPMYSRAAPSPPVRTKLSPSSRRADINHDVKTLTEQGKHLGTTGILDDTPVPPRRKLSPKNADFDVDGGARQPTSKSTEDLITF